MMNVCKRSISSYQRTVRDAVPSVLTLGFLVLVLLVSHQYPTRAITRVREAWRDGDLVASGEMFTLGFIVLLWLIVVSWCVRTVLVTTRLLIEIMRIALVDGQSHRRFNKFRMAALFFLGAISATKVTNERQEATEVTNDVRLPTPSPDALQTLPALASAGLAVGITTHVQRERAALLRDAPVSARLKKPGRAALARGIAVFERSREWTGPQAVSGAMLLPVGMCGSQLVHLSVKSGDLVSVEASEAQAITVLRHLLNTIALAPWLGESQVVLCGFDRNDVVQTRNVVCASSVADAITLALALRTSHPSATVFLVASAPATDFDSLASMGITVIFGCTNTGVQNQDISGFAHPVTRIIRKEHAWHINSQNQYFLPYGVTKEEAAEFRTMVQEMTLVEHDPKDSIASSRSTPSVMVRILGPVEVLTEDASEVLFRKAKSLELLCWLCLHRDHPTVSGARTALWEVNVEDATFHNVLSELRRGLVSCGLRDAVRRESKNRLVLDGRITTDIDELRSSLLIAERAPSPAAIDELVDAIVLVRGLPFADRSYAWADAEGITSTLVWLVTRAIELSVEFAKSQGDESTVLDATAAGLRMLPSDEQFLELRQSVALRRTTNGGGVAQSPSR